jgi:hypothetical protein
MHTSTISIAYFMSALLQEEVPMDELMTVNKALPGDIQDFEGPIRRLEGGSEWEPIKILLDGD